MTSPQANLRTGFVTRTLLCSAILLNSYLYGRRCIGRHYRRTEGAIPNVISYCVYWQDANQWRRLESSAPKNHPEWSSQLMMTSVYPWSTISQQQHQHKGGCLSIFLSFFLPILFLAMVNAYIHIYIDMFYTYLYMRAFVVHMCIINVTCPPLLSRRVAAWQASKTMPPTL